MVQSQFSLSWDKHKTIFCNGFRSLQQNCEFVDMTIAADGHFVEVHQMVIALASPYLKELITSAPCQHPVIFLNNVSHKTLCSLLEYVYTGEVLLAAESLAIFLETAKSLHINGLENLSSSECLPVRTGMNISQLDTNELQKPLTSSADKMEQSSSECLPVRMGTNISQLETNEFKNMLTSSADKTEQMNMPLTRKILSTSDSTTESAYSAPTTSSSLNTNVMSDYCMVDDSAQDSDDDHHYQNQTSTLELHASILNANTCPDKDSVLYTVSNRGALQLIHNRFMYHCHYKRENGRKRRWRCIDYRDTHCPAFIYTVGEQIVMNGEHGHSHPNHNEKIYKKIERSNCFPTIELAEPITRKFVKKIKKAIVFPQ